MSTKIPNEIKFRSGCSSRKDLVSFRIANENVGSSIYYFKSMKLTDSYPMSLQETLLSKEPLFLDNGLIQHISTGTEFVVGAALARYKEIVDTYRNSQYLTIVVPDDPMDEENAFATIKNNKQIIKYLIKKCRVMIPIHRTKNRTLTEQALRISKELDHVKFTVGIPCKTDNGWRLNEKEIVELLSVKHANKPLFNDVHFFRFVRNLER